LTASAHADRRLTPAHANIVLMRAEQTSATREGLIAAYLALREKSGPEHEELFWAHEAVDDVVRNSPSEGWALTRELIEAAVDDPALMYVAAGPLEDLLKKHGEHIIDDVITAARRDAKVRRALAGAWGRSSMNPRVAAEIERILSPATGSSPTGARSANRQR
jgi:hypothetical protein